MKIAVISENGKTISQHFGRAPFYVVVTVDDGKVVGKEIRDKTGHQAFAAHDDDTAPGERHGYSPGAESRHTSMKEAIADCQVLIVGGMGWGAYESMKGSDIEAVVTDVRDVDEAVKLYLEGKLPNLMDRLH